MSQKRLPATLAAMAAFSAFSSLASAAIVSSGSTTIPGTFTFSFDIGAISASPADVFWEQFTSTTRALQGSAMVNLGVVNFSALTLSDLEGETYSNSPIDGSDIGSVLTPGDVFAVETLGGNFAKAEVTGPLDSTADNGLPIEWVTFSPAATASPEPASIALAGGALALFALARRRNKRRGE
jgi:PEP-CTERM motif